MFKKQGLLWIIISALLLIICSYVYFSADNTQAMSVSTEQSRRFLRAYQLIKHYYIKPVSDQDLITNAINGMLQGLDNYSRYLDANKLQQLKQITTGEYTGIGIEVIDENGVLKVVTALDNSPARRAGILPKDEIIEINHQLVADMDFQQAINALRGPAGSKVKIVIARNAVSKPITMTILREKLHIQNIRKKLMPHGIGYLRIAVFQANTGEEIRQTIDQLIALNHGPLKGLILDLRNNPGGLLQSAADVSNLFLNKSELKKNDLIVYSKGRLGKILFTANANSIDILRHAPIIILINQGSASAAEIVAGALHDHHRAILIGEKTFGKGSVQTIIPIDKNSAIKLTTALYYTPAGNLIDHIGIQPDIKVQIKPNAKEDEVLARGITFLQEKQYVGER